MSFSERPIAAPLADVFTKYSHIISKMGGDKTEIHINEMQLSHEGTTTLEYGVTGRGTLTVTNGDLIINGNVSGFADIIVPNGNVTITGNLGRAGTVIAGGSVTVLGDVQTGARAKVKDTLIVGRTIAERSTILAGNIICNAGVPQSPEIKLIKQISHTDEGRHLRFDHV
jgi:formylmethanofuran dehydrogenase subunit C